MEAAQTKAQPKVISRPSFGLLSVSHHQTNGLRPENLEWEIDRLGTCDHFRKPKIALFEKQNNLGDFRIFKMFLKETLWILNNWVTVYLFT